MIRSEFLFSIYKIMLGKISPFVAQSGSAKLVLWTSISDSDFLQEVAPPSVFNGCNINDEHRPK